MLVNAVEHYQNRHNKCPATARCKQDENYEPSKEIITDPVAVRLFTEAIMGTPVYKSPADFCLAMDTHYVESFNNVLNVFHDKRIVFGKRQYHLRTNLAICHWNENVNRPFTSMSCQEDAEAHRRKMGKKVLKPRTFQYRVNIWNRLMDLVFSS